MELTQARGVMVAGGAGLGHVVFAAAGSDRSPVVHRGRAGGTGRALTAPRLFTSACQRTGGEQNLIRTRRDAPWVTGKRRPACSLIWLMQQPPGMQSWQGFKATSRAGRRCGWATGSRRAARPLLMMIIENCGRGPYTGLLATHLSLPEIAREMFPLLLHRQLGGDFDLPEAGRLLTESGGGAGAGSRPPRR